MKYLLLFPAVLAVALFLLWPIGELVRYSTLKTNFITTSSVGLLNYRNMFHNTVFLRSWGNSFCYMAIMVAANMVVSTGIVLIAFTLKKRWHDFIRISFYVPVLAAGVIIAQVWRWVFHARGPINWILSFFGVDPIYWFAQGITAIPAVSLVVVVSAWGGTVIILLAYVLSIDPALYDAATIDGATWGQIKRRIVRPLMWPAIAMVSLMAMIAAAQVFETIYVLAPYEYSASVTFHIYREAFVFGRFGYASAQAIMLLLVTAAMTIGKKRIEQAIGG